MEDGASRQDTPFTEGAKEGMRYIWFSAPKEEEILDNDITPGLSLKFKEAAEGDQRIESRLASLERGLQVLVDSSTKNDRRRAKNTFDKAFSTKSSLSNF